MNNPKYVANKPTSKNLTLVAAALSSSIFSLSAYAACSTVFQAVITIGGGPPLEICRDSIESIYTDAIRDAGTSFPGAATAALSSNLRLYGVGASINFSQGSNVLNFSIPELGINNSFNGATRADSAILLRQFLENNPDIFANLQKRQAAVSPLSPITGTSGVLPRAIISDFNSSFNDTPTRIATSQSTASQGSQSVLGAGVLVSMHDVANSKVKTLSIPLSYTVRNDIDPRRQALIRGGLGIVDTAGSRSYQGRLSAGYRFPMSDEWVLTPMGGLSFAASKDAAFAVGVGNASLASTYTWEFESFDLTMGNMLGYYQTFKLPVKFSGDPKIRIAALVNGIFLSQPINIADSKMAIEYGFSDSRLGGTELYQNNSQELTISLGTNKSALSARSFFRATLAAQRAKDSKGVSLGLNYWF